MNTNHDPQCRKYFSWKAVLVGGVVAFGLLFLFNILTVGGGLAVYTKTEKGLETLVALAYLWTIFGSFLMLFIAGMVTAMIINHDHCSTEPCHGVLHGFVTWVVYILISLMFLSHVSEATIVTFPQNFLGVSKDTLAVSDAETPITTSTVHRAREKGTPVNEEVQKEAHKIGIAKLSAFFIFLLEAIGACFGAWIGMDLCRRKCR